MLEIRQKLQAAKNRLNPAGLAISAGIAGLSFFGIPTFQAALTYGIHEIGHSIPTDSMKIISIATIGLANLASIIVESKTLKHKQYSASVLASTINMASGKPVIASLASHTVNFFQSYGMNPVHAFNIAAAVSGDEGRLFFENAAGVGLALGVWAISFNTLIRKGKAGWVKKNKK